MNPQDQQAFLWRVINRFDLYIGSTNAKAALLAAFNSFMIGAVVLKWGDLLAGFAGHPNATRGAAILLAIAALASLVSLGAVFLSIAPFLRSPKSPGKYHSLLFFEHVTEHSSGDTYAETLTAASESSLLSDLAHQAHTLAKAASAKFRWIAIAVWAIVVGQLGPFGVLLLLKLWITVFP